MKKRIAGAGKKSFLPVILVVLGMILWFAGTLQLENSGNGDMLTKVGQVTVEEPDGPWSNSDGSILLGKNKTKLVTYEGMFLSEQASARSFASKIPGLAVLLILPVMAVVYYYRPFDRDILKKSAIACIALFVVTLVSMIIVYGSQRGFASYGGNKSAATYNVFMYYEAKEYVPGSELFQRIYGLKYAITKQPELIFYFVTTVLADLVWFAVPFVCYGVFGLNVMGDYSGVTRKCVNCGEIYRPGDTACFMCGSDMSIVIEEDEEEWKARQRRKVKSNRQEKDEKLEKWRHKNRGRHWLVPQYRYMLWPWY